MPTSVTTTNRRKKIVTRRLAVKHTIDQGRLCSPWFCAQICAHPRTSRSELEKRTDRKNPYKHWCLLTSANFCQLALSYGFFVKEDLEGRCSIQLSYGRVGLALYLILGHLGLALENFAVVGVEDGAPRAGALPGCATRRPRTPDRGVHRALQPPAHAPLARAWLITAE